MSVLVIAGSSSESGHAVASLFTEAGWTVIALGSSAERLQTVTAAERIEVDLRDATATSAVAQRIVERWGRVDGVVHLVGHWSPGHGDAALEKLMESNVTTLRISSLAFWDALVASGDGRFAMVSTTVLDKPTWRDANYAVSKAAAETWVRSFSRSWAKEATAAAVILRIKFLGTSKGATTVEELAQAVLALWEKPVAELNGATIDLTAS